MRAILLAAGTGRRLQRPFPKCLVDIGGMTLLSRTLRALAAVKVIEAWIVVGYRHDLIAAELDRFPRRCRWSASAMRHI
jgi:choline kinase